MCSCSTIKFPSYDIIINRKKKIAFKLKYKKIYSLKNRE